MAESIDFERRFKAALRDLKKAPAETADDSLEGVETIEDDVGSAEKISQASPTPINLFQHPDAHPVVLDLALLKKYGPEWMLWEPETLSWRVPQDFKTSGVSTLNMGKIQAMKTLHYNDTYWQRWEVFNWCTQPFNNAHADFEVMQVPSTAQMMVSVDTASRVREDVTWSDEVVEFMISACKFDGIFCPPEPLSFLKVAPDNDLIDCEAVSLRWPAVRAENKVPMGATIVDEQLRRNLDVYRFLQSSRERLQNQLALVLNA